MATAGLLARMTVGSQRKLMERSRKGGRGALDAHCHWCSQNWAANGITFGGRPPHRLHTACMLTSPHPSSSLHRLQPCICSLRLQSAHRHGHTIHLSLLVYYCLSFSFCPSPSALLHSLPILLLPCTHSESIESNNGRHWLTEMSSSQAGRQADRQVDTQTSAL